MDVPRNATDLILRIYLTDDAGAPLTGLVYDPLDLSILDIQVLTLTDEDWVSHRLDPGTLLQYNPDTIVEISAGWYQYCPANSLITPGQATQFRVLAGSNRPIPGVINAVETESSISGPHTVTITVDDSTDPIEGATVRIHRSGESETKVTDAAGQVVFTVDAAAWSVSITASGFAGQTNALAVAADVTPTYSLSAVAGSTPADPSLCAIDCYVYLNGTPIEGATVVARIVDTNSAIDGIILSTAKTTETTDSDGLATLQLVRLDQFVDGDGEYTIEAFDGERLIWSVTTTIPNVANVNLEDLVSP